MCLVSRKFRQIAQPLLFEVIRIESEQAFELVSDALKPSTGQGRLVRHIVWDSKNRGDQTQLEALISVCPHLRDLNLCVSLFDTVSLNNLGRWSRE